MTSKERKLNALLLASADVCIGTTRKRKAPDSFEASPAVCYIRSKPPKPPKSPKPPKPLKSPKPFTPPQRDESVESVEVVDDMRIVASSTPPPPPKLLALPDPPQPTQSQPIPPGYVVRHVPVAKASWRRL